MSVRQTLFGLSQSDEGDVHVQASSYVSLQTSAPCMPTISRQSCNCRMDASRARVSSSQTFYLHSAAGTTQPFGASVICPRTEVIMVRLVCCHLICRKGHLEKTPEDSLVRPHTGMWDSNDKGERQILSPKLLPPRFMCLILITATVCPISMYLILVEELISHCV